ncbi:MAG: tetratricopeptide repeat protein [Dorea sp.]|nr:tetratricopeptide repeat protein [Dorea sp.]
MKRRVRLSILLFFCVILAGCGKREYRDGMENLENGQYEEAIEQFEAAIEQEYSVGDSYRGIGIAKWETGDYEGAVSAFETALENGSAEDGTVYHLLGSCKMQMGDWLSAIEYYEKGISQGNCTDDAEKEMKFNIIAAYENLKDWDNAKAKLAEYVSEYPEDAQAAKEAEFLETR